MQGVQSWAEVMSPERKRKGRLEDWKVVALGSRAAPSVLEVVVVDAVLA